MLLTADVVYYAEDGITRLVTAIENDEELTTPQKRQQVKKFADQPVKADTSGSWVNANTGEPVELIPVYGNNEQPEVITDYQPPLGSITEITFWQNIPLIAFLVGQGIPSEVLAPLSQIKFSQLFYGAIQQGMMNMDSRKRF